MKCVSDERTWQLVNSNSVWRVVLRTPHACTCSYETVYLFKSSTFTYMLTFDVYCVRDCTQSVGTYPNAVQLKHCVNQFTRNAICWKKNLLCIQFEANLWMNERFPLIAILLNWWQTCFRKRKIVLVYHLFKDPVCITTALLLNTRKLCLPTPQYYDNIICFLQIENWNIHDLYFLFYFFIHTIAGIKGANIMN